MLVSIVKLSGDILELDVEPTASVQGLQHRARALSGGCRVKLVHAGQVLIPTATLADSAVEAGALITLVTMAQALYVLTASSDGTAKLWSIESGACIQTFAGHEDDVSSATFSVDI